MPFIPFMPCMHTLLNTYLHIGGGVGGCTFVGGRLCGRYTTYTLKPLNSQNVFFCAARPDPNPTRPNIWQSFSTRIPYPLRLLFLFFLKNFNGKIDSSLWNQERELCAHKSPGPRLSLNRSPYHTRPYICNTLPFTPMIPYPLRL